MKVGRRRSARKAFKGILTPRQRVGLFLEGRERQRGKRRSKRI